MHHAIIQGANILSTVHLKDTFLLDPRSGNHGGRWQSDVEAGSNQRGSSGLFFTGKDLVQWNVEGLYLFPALCAAERLVTCFIL